MDSHVLLGILMFVTLVGTLFTGIPIAFALSGTALIFFVIGLATGDLAPVFLSAFPQRVYGIMTNDVLLAIPLFIFMGVMLERSKIAEELLETSAKLFGGLAGGLGLSIMAVGALLAATTGMVGATVTTMGMIALPAMLRHGYDPRLAAGSIAAAGTLGQIIPPSIVLVVLGDQLGTAHQAAELAKGNFAPDPLTVGDLFAGAIGPGLLLVLLYMVYIGTLAALRPKLAPAMPVAARRFDGSVGAELMRALIPALLLIVAVLGSLLAGVATATESSALGALGAVLLAARRVPGVSPRPIDAGAIALLALLALRSLVDLRVGRQTTSGLEDAAILAAFVLMALVTIASALAFWRLLRTGLLGPTARVTTDVTAMIFLILIGATLFSLVFRGLDGEALVRGVLAQVPGGALGAVALVMAVMFVLGFFLDFLEIVFVVIPIVAPVLLAMEGVDAVWLGVMMAINLQTSFLTPPFGPTLFYLRAVAPPSVTTLQIYAGVAPFVLIQLCALALLWLMPELATWLPKQLYG
jgi:TRAP-type mannitol/chloroaromatic compound transport system permease large subunit